MTEPHKSRHSIASLLREPLVHFLCVGMLLFVAAGWWRDRHDMRRIVVDEATVAGLVAAHEAEFGTSPDAVTTERLIDEHIAAEVLYREGVARGLDRDDEIVRRRVIQKVAFLETDLAPLAEPDEAALRAWHARHASRYAAPAAVDFSHVFFAAAPGDETAARARAASVLGALDDAEERAEGRGDSFPDQYAFSGFTREDAVRLFGQSELASALHAAPVGRWAGPYRSAYGWHLVRLARAVPGKALPFAAVRDRVREELLAERRSADNSRRIARLRQRYVIVRADK